jgi:hypothetical protein
MMSEKQRSFRERYRARIEPWYNGLVHILVMYGVGLSILYYCARQLHQVGVEWMLIVPVAIAGNLVEWSMHRFVMHRRIDVYALRAIYERHTREHHQYFTDANAEIDAATSLKEFRIVFFPWRVLIVLGVAGSLFGYLTSLVWNANAGYFVLMTMMAHYMLYETFHYCCHVPENSFVANMPLVNTIRRHHKAHHNQGIMMRRNMNLTFPFSDWLLKSSDLNRGLLGHLFNGYNEQYVRAELKPIIERFKKDDSRSSLDGPLLTDEERQVLERQVLA